MYTCMYVHFPHLLSCFLQVLPLLGRIPCISTFFMPSCSEILLQRTSRVENRSIWDLRISSLYGLSTVDNIRPLCYLIFSKSILFLPNIVSYIQLITTKRPSRRTRPVGLSNRPRDFMPMTPRRE